MGLKMWMVLLWILLFVKGVSFASNCSADKNIQVSLGEDIILDIDEDEVTDNTLIDGDGNDIAEIRNGELTIINKRYNDILTSKGFSFHINSTAIKGKKNFTASVLYTNGSHCTQHYSVTVIGREICSKIKSTEYILGGYFTLDFDAPGVENITWLFGSNRTIAITKDKANLQILDSNYEGILSVINASLRKYSAIKEDVGDYTARVIFRNGTQCQQHYSVTIEVYSWWNFTLCLDEYKVASAMLVIVLACFGIGIRKYWLKRKEKKANETKRRTYNRNIEKENVGNCRLEEDYQHEFMLQRKTI